MFPLKCSICQIFSEKEKNVKKYIIQSPGSLISYIYIHTHIYIMKVKVLVTQSCLTLCGPMDCSLLGSSVHGIFQARILEWVAISFSRGSSHFREWTRVSHIAGRFFTIWATREARMSHIIGQWASYLNSRHTATSGGFVYLGHVKMPLVDHYFQEETLLIQISWFFIFYQTFPISFVILYLHSR